MRKIDEDEYMEAADELRAARVIFSREWQIARTKAHSDMAATQIAIERTGDAITMIQAKMRVMEGKL